MTAPTDTLIETVVEGTRRTQEAFTGAVRTWADTVQGFATGLAGQGRPQLPDTNAVVDRWFDAAQQALDTQRRFVHTVLGAQAQAAEVVTEQAARAAESVVSHGQNAAEGVAKTTDKAAETAGEQAANGVRAARTATTKS